MQCDDLVAVHNHLSQALSFCFIGNATVTAIRTMKAITLTSLWLGGAPPREWFRSFAFRDALKPYAKLVHAFICQAPVPTWVIAQIKDDGLFHIVVLAASNPSPILLK